jgi:Protein of unknown function (DUF2917)
MTRHLDPICISTTLHRLRRHQALNLRRPNGLCVRAERGSLWVTVDGDLADILIAPGASRVFYGPAPVVISTLDRDAVASITAKAAPPWAHRRWGWLQRLAQRVLA